MRADAVITNIIHATLASSRKRVVGKNVAMVERRLRLKAPLRPIGESSRSWAALDHRDGVEKVTGHARYSGDVLPNMLYGKILAAHIPGQGHQDRHRQEFLPGVKAVLRKTQRLAHVGTKFLRCLSEMPHV
jgi:hypothetical protein